MTAFQWAIDLAKELIDQNGEACEVTVFTSQVDPDHPNESLPSAALTFPARAVWLNYGTKEAGTTYQDGTQIHRDDKKVLMAAKGMPVAPNLQGTIARGNGEKYRIIVVKGLDPDGPSIYFEVHARQ